MKKFSLIAFAFFLIAAFIKNRGIFIANLTTVFPLVVLHNILALSAGYLFARLVKLPTADARTITFETGVQNSALGLILIFTFFGGMAGMAIVAALWGIWHLVTGGGLALWWGRQAKTA
jgi:BASS family bile acid:Na+ symporter